MRPGRSAKDLRRRRAYDRLVEQYKNGGFGKFNEYHVAWRPLHEILQELEALRSKLNTGGLQDV